MTDLLLLCAGMGRRLGASNDLPKVLMLLPYGRSLLAQNLSNAFASAVVDRVVVVTGHQAALVEQEIARHERAQSIDVVLNPGFATSGPIRSVWAARDLTMEHDLIIANGDTFYRPAAFHELWHNGEQGLRLAYSRRDAKDDDVKLMLTAEGQIRSVGKEVAPEQADGVSAGLFLALGSGPRELVWRVVEERVIAGDGEQRRLIWHDLVNELARGGRAVRAIELPADFWHEVDTAADYARLCELIDPANSR